MNPRGSPWGLELRACGWGSAVEGGAPGRHLWRRELPPSGIRIPALHMSTIIGCNLGLLHPLYPVPGMKASSRAREAIFYLHMECEGHKLRAMSWDRGEQTRTGREEGSRLAMQKCSTRGHQTHGETPAWLPLANMGPGPSQSSSSG